MSAHRSRATTGRRRSSASRECAQHLTTGSPCQGCSPGTPACPRASRGLWPRCPSHGVGTAPRGVEEDTEQVKGASHIDDRLPGLGLLPRSKLDDLLGCLQKLGHPCPGVAPPRALSAKRGIWSAAEASQACPLPRPSLGPLSWVWDCLHPCLSWCGMGSRYRGHMGQDFTMPTAACHSPEAHWVCFQAGTWNGVGAGEGTPLPVQARPLLLAGLWLCLMATASTATNTSSTWWPHHHEVQNLVACGHSPLGTQHP